MPINHRVWLCVWQGKCLPSRYFRRIRHYTVRGRLKALKISNDTFQGCQVWHYAPLSLTRCLHLCPHQPQHTPHLRQAAVAAALRQSQLLEGQFGNCEDQPPDPVPLCLRSLSPKPSLKNFPLSFVKLPWLNLRSPFFYSPNKRLIEIFHGCFACLNTRCKSCLAVYRGKW